MITETTRRCSACNELLDGEERACPKCGRVQCTPVAEWPADARRLLSLMLIADVLATKLRATEQQQHEHLLENAMRGRWYPGGRLIPYAASAADCYPMFVTLLERWIAAGSPTDFTAIAQLRGAR
jgi:hypothetical protein